MRAFRLNWKVTLFSAVFLVVFLRLGYWQLTREDEKTKILAEQASRQVQTPITVSEAAERAPEKAHLLPLATRGEYDESSIFLLDNRVLNGTVGFEVLVPFQETASGLWILVNRGFVPMGRTRQDIPAVPALPDEETGLRGQIYRADYRNVAETSVAARLGEMTVVQVADPTVISALAGIDLYPNLVRLAVSDEQALPRHWPITVMQPETHRGYAVQWFLMALAVVIAWTAFTVTDNRAESDIDG